MKINNCTKQKQRFKEIKEAKEKERKRYLEVRKMSMEFCDVCGSMLAPKKIDGKVVMVCPKCGEGKKEIEKGELRTEKIQHSEKEKMVVIENPDELTINPTKPMHCPNCKKVQETEYWAVQTRSGDEAATRFYRCTKCKQTWREYD